MRPSSWGVQKGSEPKHQGNKWIQGEGVTLNWRNRKKGRDDVHRCGQSVGLEAVSWQSFHLIPSIFHVMYELRPSARNEEGVGKGYIILKRIKKGTIVESGTVSWYRQHGRVAWHYQAFVWVNNCDFKEMPVTLFWGFPKRELISFSDRPLVYPPNTRPKAYYALVLPLSLVTHLYSLLFQF